MMDHSRQDEEKEMKKEEEVEMIAFSAILGANVEKR